MIKRTLYFGSPARLKTRHNQLIISKEDDEEVTVPIEDVGFIILDHYGILISQPVLSRLIDNNVAIITTNDKHMPNGMFLNLEGNTIQSEIFRNQRESSKSLKKRIWKQTVIAKIVNQATLLEMHSLGGMTLRKLASKVKSGDPENCEAQAARIYFRRLFHPFRFRRYREGPPPNNVLNYGYAILRAVIARSLIGSGLLPTLGIHHRNRYNAYPLADDIMEPYRPFVDEIVVNLVINDIDLDVLTTDVKREMLQIPQLPVLWKKETSPLMVACTKTTASLAQCFSREGKQVVYPKLCD